MTRIMLIWVGGLALLLAGSSRADDECTGAGDLDADGLVAITDLNAFAACMAGGPDATVPPVGCDPDEFARADLDGDSDADLSDFAQLAHHVGTAYFAYGKHRDDLEAEMLAMDLTGQLRAPEVEYERIRGDLERIRAEYANLTGVIDDMDYAPNELLVKLIDGQPLDAYQAINEHYLVVNEESLFSTWWVLTFCDNLNAVVLSDIYAALPAVQYADPNYLVGTDDQITVTVLGETYRYSIDDGFMDCFDGCDCHREWVLDVDTSGNVTLISYDEWGQSWCSF